MNKTLLLAAASSLLFIACGKKTESQESDYRDSSLYMQDDSDGDARVERELLRWIYQGNGNQSEGQKFCDILELGASGHSFQETEVLEGLSEEQLKMYSVVKSDPSKNEISDSSGELMCKKEKVKTSFP